MRWGGNTSVSSAIAASKCSTRTTNRLKSSAARAERRGSSAIPGGWPSTQRATSTLPTPRTIGCRSSSGNELPIHPSLLPVAAGPGAGVGDLVCVEDRRAGPPVAALDRLGDSHRGADRAGVRDCRPPVAATGGGHERVLRAGPLRQHPFAATGGCPGIRQPYLQ